MSALRPAALLALASPALAQCESDLLLHSHAQPHDGGELGWDVALDGAWAALGEPGIVFDVGRVSLVERGPTAWHLRQVIEAPPGAFHERFGRDVALDGDLLAVQARPATYVYRRAGATWVPDGTLTPTSPPPTPGADAGTGIALDGERALLGNPYAGPVHAGGGSAHLFEPAPGAGWVETATLSDPAPGADEGFATSVALRGEWAFVSAPGEHGSAAQEGTVHVFHDSGAGFAHAGELRGSDPDADDRFGDELAFDGTTLLVSAGVGGSDLWGDLRDPEVYAFELVGGSWQEVAHLPTPSGTPNDGFGRALDVEGDRALVGWPKGALGGAAQLLERVGGAWSLGAVVSVPELEGGDRFGMGVALAGERAVVRAPQWSFGPYSCGGAWVFSLDGSECATLDQTPLWIFAFPGDTVTLSLDAGPAHGGAVYVVTGSATLEDTVGVLAPDGTATAKVHFPNLFGSPFAQSLVHHAFVVLDPALRVVHASNAVPTGIQ